MPKESPNNRCEALTRTGTRCRNPKAPGSMFCRRHACPIEGTESQEGVAGADLQLSDKQCEPVKDARP